MFSMFSSKTQTKVDLHSHLLPAMDDGSKSMADSLEMIKELKKLGYEKLIITPHISDLFPNDRKSILEGYGQLKSELKKQEIAIEIEIGAEYYADENFEKLLLNREILSFGSKNYLLFELSYFTPHQNVEELIYEIQLNGYTPILAHPERYLYWHDELSRYPALKEEGVLFQVNINSINGYYNKAVQGIAYKLIKNRLVDFLGSDTHHMTHLKNLKRTFSHSLYKKAFKLNTILNDSL